MLWIDPDIINLLTQNKNTDKYSKYATYLYNYGFENNYSFLLKSNTELAKAYIKSELFKITMKNKWNFRIILNMLTSKNNINYK